MLSKSNKITQFLHSLRRQLFSVRCLLAVFMAVFTMIMVSLPAHAATPPTQAAIDEYVRRYLEVTEPIALNLDGQGQTKLFSPQDLAEGKKLFKTNCINCHVGGATLPAPTVSLALDTLAGATPPRDNINGLVEFLRHPMTYNNSEPSFWCREVPESGMPQEQIEKLAAFVLRAAQKAPGWGTSQL